MSEMVKIVNARSGRLSSGHTLWQKEQLRDFAKVYGWEVEELPDGELRAYSNFELDKPYLTDENKERIRRNGVTTPT